MATRWSPHPLAASATGAIRVDGLLTEASWRTATPITEFRQREPVEGALSTEATEVRIIAAGDVLYVGVIARDTHPERIVSRILARDKVMETEFDGKPKFAGDDAIAILIDPFHDHRNAFLFATNPNGAEFDAFLTDEGKEYNIDWRGIWTVAAKRTAEGWSAEFAIPFARSAITATAARGVQRVPHDPPWQRGSPLARLGAGQRRDRARQSRRPPRGAR
ncbi:MAG: carbohydrate binding family 9 domain-containing protein [Gemmatimonadetes bacterium]|nr:carbohydrate binding family 9 domain-containing protein [Gemmatimonadota bacterium]